MIRSSSMRRLAPCGSRRRVPWLLLGALSLALPLAAACDDGGSDESTETETPGAILWDNEWTYLGTQVLLKDGSTVPLPWNRPVLEEIRYGLGGGGGAPPTGEELEGARVVFEVDGRVLVQVEGSDELEDFGTDYRIIEEGLMRASIRKSIWFKYEYTYDTPTNTLLIMPEEDAGGTVLGLVLDLLQRTLFSGALDGAAARITEFLFEDPRVEEAIDHFLYELIHGQVEGIPIQDPADVTAWIIQVLRDNELVGENVPDAVLEAAITPIVEALLPLDREGLTQELVDRIMDSGIISDVISPERVEAALTFVFYKKTIEKGQNYSDVKRVDILLERAEPVSE